MFRAVMREGGVLKKIVEAIKDIVSNVNIDAGPNGISMQAMDPSHVALVNLSLKDGGFQEYRADKTFPLGIKLAHLNKILKCASNDDIITLECEDEPTQLTLKFENSSKYSPPKKTPKSNPKHPPPLHWPRDPKPWHQRPKRPKGDDLILTLNFLPKNSDSKKPSPIGIIQSELDPIRIGTTTNPRHPILIANCDANS